MTDSPILYNISFRKFFQVFFINILDFYIFFYHLIDISPPEQENTMKISGIVAEYNPFHNGHKHQIEMTRQNGATHIVAVMSPFFVQRGDIAVMSKWDRVNAALKNGVDLVVELPTPAALSSSQDFAFAAVSILNHLGINELSFGSECGDVNILSRLAKLCIDSANSDGFNQYLKMGINYPTALCNFLSDTYPDIDISHIYSPNNVLAIEYIKAIIRINPNITPFTIPRTGANHDSSDTTKQFASASHIRTLLLSGKFNKCTSYIPKNIFSTYENIFQNKACTSIYDIEKIIMYKIKTMNVDDFSAINGVSEGLENRLFSCAKLSYTFDDYIFLLSTKRYTLSKLRRIVLSSALGITPSLYNSCTNYVRVLGANKKGFEVIKNVRKNSTVPITPKFADLFSLFPDNMQIEVNAHSLFTLGNTALSSLKDEWSFNPIIIS